MNILEKQGELNMKRDYFVMSYFINLWRANNTILELESFVTISPQKMICGLEKGFTSLCKHSLFILSCFFFKKKVTGTNPIKCDNYFSRPLSGFCNYAVPHYYFFKCVGKTKSVKLVQTLLGNGKRTFLKADILSLYGNRMA